MCPPGPKCIFISVQIFLSGNFSKSIIPRQAINPVNLGGSSLKLFSLIFDFMPSQAKVKSVS